MSIILYLNGPSSSGKTTLAKALQESLKEPYLHIGIDTIIELMPDKLNNWTGEVLTEGFSWQRTKDPTGHPIYQIHTGPFGKRISQTFKDMVCLLASQKYNLIIDDVSFGATQVNQWKQALRKYKVFYIGIMAPLPILETREKLRKDRLLGGAKGQYFQVHQNVTYDLEIDTHVHSLQEALDQIEKFL